MDVNSDYYDSLLTLANEILEQGKQTEAIKHYDSIIKMKPDHFIAINNKGTALLDQKKYRDAIICFEQALKINPEFAMSYNNLGYTMNCLEKNEEALEYLEICLSLDSNNYFAYKNKGISYYKQGLFKESIVEFDKSLKIKPGLIEALKYKQLAEQALHGNDNASTRTDKSTTTTTTATSLCDICCDRPKNVAFVPCGHVSCCETCSDIIKNSQKKCPICNSDINLVLKLFMT